MAIEDKDLEGLSEQERAALTEDSEDEATLKAIAGKPAPADDTASGGAGTDTIDDDDDDAAALEAAAQAKKDELAAEAAIAAGAGAAGKPAEGAADAAALAAAQSSAEPAKPAAVEQPAVVFTATAPEDAADQIKALRAEKAEVFKKLMDGEITPEQYSAKEDEILGKIDTIQTDITTANVATKLTLENAQRSYLGKVNALLDSAATEGIDYRKNPELHADLDRTVKFLANDPSNADKPEQWFLDKAHSMVKAMHGLVPAKAGDAPVVPVKKGGKAPDLSGLPPTVRNLPAAAGSDDGGEFAHLSTLSGMALERAVANMSPEQQQRWAEAD